MKIIYKNGMCGGTESDRENYYAKLDEIKDCAVESKGMWGDWYYYSIYIMSDGVMWLVTDNTEQGIPYSMETITEIPSWFE